ncbi:Tc toxin subunit A, partial [Desertimonas flava]
MAEITGQVRTTNGLAAPGLAFTFVRERFGADPEPLAEVVTADDGTYVVTDVEVDSGSTLLARTIRVGGDEITLTPLSPHQELSAMHLVVPVAAASVASEYRRLMDAVAPALQGRSLAGAQEREGRRDLSLLRRESGWDARLVAVAALSARLSEPADGRPATGIGDEAVYGLLRAGLPSSGPALARVPAAAVRAALDKSAAAGVIDLDEGARADAVAAFETFARTELLARRPAGGTSTMAELLDATGLADDGDDSARSRFERIVLDSGNAEPLWRRVAAAGFNDESIRTLRTQSKLAFLTTNNAPLMTRLAADVGPDASLGAALVANRFDADTTWAAALEEAGGAAAVPAAFAGTADPVASYSGELARRVRVAYPTHVVAGMVERDELPVGAGELNAAVATTLARAADSGFRLGVTHLDSFIEDNAAVLDGVEPDERPAVASAITTLQRAYQLSPSNAAMKVLMQQGLTSAYDIVAMPEQSFVDRYGWLFPSEREARLVHRKSEQVSAVLYNFTSMTKQVAAGPALALVSGSAERREEAVANIRRALPATPTMESLFGSMDYCECDHCRSVLGPAAYLVDLLKFLDPDPLVWEGFTADWAKRHGGEPYPHGTPYEALMQRRPDLARLALSCENTNVELPVIDLVIEILEFLVASPPGVPDAARDSGAVESADVMAEPEFSIDAAYDRLLGAAYPAVLPFDRWHETVRGYTGWLDEPLADLLEAFDAGSGDDARRYAAAVERLGLSVAEADVLTAPDPLASWWTRAGYAEGADQEASAAATLGRAKQLARRLGVTYQELADLFGTGLVNPGLAALGVLTTAGVSVADAVVWRANRSLIATDQPVAEPGQTAWLTVRSVQDRLDTVTRSYGLTGDRAADEWLAALPGGVFDDVVVLVDPDASCDFDRTIVGSATTGTAVPPERLAEIYVKLDIFVRLRRVTGWSIADLDAALAAFVPGGTAGTAPFGRPMRTALARLSQLRQVEQLLGSDERDRRRLVAFFADLDVSGPRPSYHELFLGRPVGQQDPSFVAPLGDALSTTSIGTGDAALVRSHVPALHGALGIRADDLQAICDRDGPAWDDLPLTMGAVSSLARYAFLAGSLSWPVADVLTLRRLSGVDPFAALADDPLAVIASGATPQSPNATIEFLRLARRVADSGLTPGELADLAEHRLDPADPTNDEAETESLLGPLLAAIGETLAKLSVGSSPGEPPPPSPAPGVEQAVAANIAAVLGPRGGLVAALVHGPDAL